MVNNVSFSVQGEFITDLARAWYFEEHRPYEKVEELLLNCMCGTDQRKDELKKYAKGILMGEYKFIGSTKDDSFRMVEDGKFDGFAKIDAERRLRESKEKESKEFIQDLLTQIDENKEDESNSLLDSFIKASKHDDNYGYILPDGEFIPVYWGRHHEYAIDAILENGWQEEFDEKLMNSDFNYSSNTYQTDFLIYEKGWVLLHNPSQGIAFPTFNIKMTKAQKEFLFDYYINRDELELAQKYWEED